MEYLIHFSSVFTYNLLKTICCHGGSTENYAKYLDIYHYRPQTKFAKVLFLQVSVCPWGACVVAGGGVHGKEGYAWWRGHAWQRGVCGKGGMHGKMGRCVAKRGMHSEGGHVWQRGACMGYDEIQSMSGRYESYWNAFLLFIISYETDSYANIPDVHC